MNNEIVLLGIENPAVNIPQDLVLNQVALVAQAAEIKRVSTAEEQESAVLVAGRLKKFINDIEAQRKESKKPILDLGKMLDDKIKTFVGDAENALKEIYQMIASYQDAERVRAQRIREEEEAKRREALRLAEEQEAELQKKIAASKSEMEQEKLEIELEKKKESFRETIVESHAAVVDAKPVKARGMIVGKSYDFEVLDVHLLYKQNPAFVSMEANKVVIKSMLRQGMRECPGLKIFEVETKVGVRAAR